MKWLHIIGISGKTTANIGKEFKKMGWFVSGSDHQFLPPASQIVIDAGIPYETSYHFSHLTKEHWQKKLDDKPEINENPDLVIIVESITDKNKEYLFAKNKGLDVRPYSKVLGEYLVKENSIVVVGTAGKTTTTTLITLVLKELGLDPSYMIGADVVDLADAISITDSQWSVMEGDEYFNKDLSDGAKFLEYKPKYLVITNIGYEHRDVYPTRDEYISAFKKAVDLLPTDGLIIANADDANVMSIVHDARCRVATYSEVSTDADYYFSNNQEVKIFEKKDPTMILSTTTDLLGKYNPLNFMIVAALFNELLKSGHPDIGFDLIDDSDGMKQVKRLNDLMAAVFKNFHGVKKRLEILYQSEDLIVVDDFGVAPQRAKNSLETLKDEFPEHDIVAVFEPNSGSRPKDETTFKESYATVFDSVTEIIIPELSKFNEQLADENDFMKWLSEMGINVQQVDAEGINAYLKNEKLKIKNKKMLIVFFSAYRLDSVAKEFIKEISVSQ